MSDSGRIPGRPSEHRLCNRAYRRVEDRWLRWTALVKVGLSTGMETFATLHICWQPQEAAAALNGERRRLSKGTASVACSDLGGMIPSRLGIVRSTRI